LGSRANLEHDVVFLFEAYNQPYMDVMQMPSSRRHRLVKIREEIVRSRNRGPQAPPAYHTGTSAPQAVQTPPRPGA